MGFVLLDITFRIERAFGIRLPKGWPDQLGIVWDEGGNDATLAQFHDFVLRLCREQDITTPVESWPMLVQIVEDATGMGTDEITSDTKIVRDIAPSS
jgi:hypothetical protein